MLQTLKVKVTLKEKGSRIVYSYEDLYLAISTLDDIEDIIQDIFKDYIIVEYTCQNCEDLYVSGRYCIDKLKSLI